MRAERKRTDPRPEAEAKLRWGMAVLSDGQRLGAYRRPTSWRRMQALLGAARCHR